MSQMKGCPRLPAAPGTGGSHPEKQAPPSRASPGLWEVGSRGWPQKSALPSQECWGGELERVKGVKGLSSKTRLWAPPGAAGQEKEQGVFSAGGRDPHSTPSPSVPHNSSGKTARTPGPWLSGRPAPVSRVTPTPPRSLRWVTPPRPHYCTGPSGPRRWPCRASTPARQGQTMHGPQAAGPGSPEPQTGWASQPVPSDVRSQKPVSHATQGPTTAPRPPRASQIQWWRSRLGG